MEKISIVIPTFGRALNLKRAIDSCLNQTYRNIEIIVVDDNNPMSEHRKQTSTIMKELYSSNRLVKYICHERNKNGAAARNTGIENSSGDYISFLDDDDEFLPDKLNRQVSILNNSSTEATYTRCYKYVNGIKVYETKYIESDNSKLIYDIFCQSIEINSSGLLCTKNLLNELKGFDDSFNRNQDYEFLLRVLRRHKLACIDEPLYIMHIDSSSNQLDFKRYEATRQKFMKKFKQDFIKLSMLEKLDISRLYNFDLAYYALKNGSVINGFIYFIKSCPEPYLLYLVWPRLMRIIKQK